MLLVFLSFLKTALDSSIYLKATLGCLNDLEVCICVIYVCMYVRMYYVCTYVCMYVDRYRYIVYICIVIW